MAEDFHQIWWAEDQFAESRALHTDPVPSKTFYLKLELSKFIRERYAVSDEYANELQSFSQVQVNGIVTTNWDTFLEETFSDFDVLVGQEAMLFRDRYFVGDIFKIHGCASTPESIVLTSDDYDEFNSKNAYLAAKLLTRISH